MDVIVRHDPQRHRYDLVGDDGSVVGRLDYRESGGVIAMWHTEVDPAYGGRGYGSVLVRGALDDARARGLRVRPACPFVARYLDRHPDYADLVSP